MTLEELIEEYADRMRVVEEKECAECAKRERELRAARRDETSRDEKNQATAALRAEIKAEERRQELLQSTIGLHFLVSALQGSYMKVMGSPYISPTPMPSEETALLHPPIPEFAGYVLSKQKKYEIVLCKWLLEEKSRLESLLGDAFSCRGSAVAARRGARARAHRHASRTARNRETGKANGGDTGRVREGEETM